MKRPALYYVCKAWLWLVASAFVAALGLGAGLLTFAALQGVEQARAFLVAAAIIAAVFVSGLANDYIERQK